VQRALRITRWITTGGLIATAAGIVVLFLSSLREVLTDPSLSLEDGYWIGRLPWTAVGVVLVVIGATVAVVAGTIAAWIAGGWVRRALTGVSSAIAAFWWLLVIVWTPGGGGYCPGCSGLGFDPVTVAYSLPQGALLLLVAPAAVIGVAVLTARRSYTPAATPSNQVNAT